MGYVTSNGGRSNQDVEVAARPQLDASGPFSANELFEANLHCKFKAHLLSQGQSGSKCDYETLCSRLRDNVRRMALEKLLAEKKSEELPNDIILTRQLLVRAKPFIFNAHLSTEMGVLHFDGLKKVDGASRIGAFHYIPLLFYGGQKARKEQKALLDLCGLCLSGLQGRMPSRGGIYCGSECRLATVRLSTDLGKARRLIEDVGRLGSSNQPPPLILNDHCQVCEFRHQCHQQAVEQGNLSLLGGIGEKEIKAYARKGILTLTQLAHTFRPRRKGKRVERSKHRYHALQAMALRDKTVFVLGTPSLPVGPVKVYLDVEGDPDEGYIYLIGMVVCDGVSEQSYSFWADSKVQEIVILQQFIQELSRYGEFQVFCYGGYDKAFLKRMRPKVTGKKCLDNVLKSLTNVLSVIYDHIYFPCYTNGLKDVAAYLGYSWTDKAASGIQSIVWRKEWEATLDDTWKQRLVTYNLEDCYALKRVSDFLCSITINTASPPELLVGKSDGVPQSAVTWVADLDKLSDWHKWGDVDFFHPDYQYINRCAYFDYQRRRVFVRTSRTIRKSVRKVGTKQHHIRRLRVSQRISIASSKCPFCKSTNLFTPDRQSIPSTHMRRTKRAFDLVMTSSGIRRKVIECRALIQQCGACGKVFVPNKYEHLDPHFHGLKSWAMFQHIAYGMSFGTLEEMLREFFDLGVYKPELHVFKSLLARYYKPTYRRLLKNLLSGAVMHTDDTEVKLRTGKGYVSVFASMEEVVFMYRPTAEGDFLREVLKDFHGVLISDFHPIYDSLLCPQQKCLIHLMRDINQELLNTPFDQELQMISGHDPLRIEAVAWRPLCGP